MTHRLCFVDLCILNVDGASMVIYWYGLTSPCSQSLDVSLQNNLDKGDDHAEDKPDVYHLDVGGFWKIVEHSDIPCKNEILVWIFEFLLNLHGHQNQHNGQLRGKKKINMFQFLRVLFWLNGQQWNYHPIRKQGEKINLD